MKIFAIANNYPLSYSLPVLDNKAGSEAFIEERAEPVVYAVPDTALLKDNRPFFIPDFARPCTYQASTVLRIGRLGKSIAQRFAHRYVDGITVGIAFTADNLWREAVAKGLPWDVSKGFDNAAVVGRFLPLDCASSEELEHAAAQPFIVTERPQDSADEVKTQDALLAHAEPRFSPAALVAHLSRYYLLRQGDLIYTGFPCAPRVASIDHHLTVYLDGAQLLSFNIK